MTSALAQYIEEKIGSLDRFIAVCQKHSCDHQDHPPVEAFLEVARTTRHHKQGDVFSVALHLRIKGQFIRAEKQGEDIYAAIDGVREEMKNELHKEKGIQESKLRRSGRILKRLYNLSPLAWFRKEKK